MGLFSNYREARKLAKEEIKGKHLNNAQIRTIYAKKLKEVRQKNKAKKK